MAAKFTIGETVQFSRGPGDTNVPPGPFTVTRVMPLSPEGQLYRVHGTVDGRERVLPESQLSLPVSSAKPASQKEAWPDLPRTDLASVL